MYKKKSVVRNKIPVNVKNVNNEYFKIRLYIDFIFSFSSFAMKPEKETVRGDAKEFRALVETARYVLAK